MSQAHRDALAVVREKLSEATAAEKCHPCRCLHETVAALAKTEPARELCDSLAAARAELQPVRYDCLGCAVCYPAIAANAFADAFSDSALELDVCPTDAPHERAGWPPLPGDYVVARYRAPVAVCTLASDGLAARLASRAPEGLAIVGSLQTENLGIERLMRNILANPNIRWLVLCGEDTRQAIGHLPGQSLESLFAGGLDERGRIRGAQGKRPVIKNLGREEVDLFLRQVELRSMIGEVGEDAIVRAVEDCAAREVQPLQRPQVGTVAAPTVEASEPRELSLDRAGFLVVYPDRRAKRLVVEHYTSAGLLTCVIEGRTPAAVCSEVIARALIERLDHAAYLGRELTRAERSLETGEPYVQDRAPGELEPPAGGCGCSKKSGCGGEA